MPGRPADDESSASAESSESFESSESSESSESFSSNSFEPGSDEHTETTGSARLRGAVAPALASGDVLDSRYQVEAVIGEGGSGTVFRAWDRVLGEPVAVKILQPARASEKSWIKRLAREVKVARAIRHPNVCRVFDMGHANDHWFVTMELATGGTLRQLLRDRGPALDGDGQPTSSPPPRRPLGEKLNDARALCAGLAAIHAVNIIHRDVTPQNVLRMADGRLVISDFGLAIETNDNTTIHGGTPAYMPPEVAMGERSDQRADVWQLGVLMHEILFDRRPEWDRTESGIAMRWPLGAAASAVEEELARLCSDCLAHNPAQRPETAMVVAGRLAAAELARPRGSMSRLWTQARALIRRHRALRLAVVVGLLGAIAVRAAQLLARPSLCRGAPGKIAGIWDPAVKALARRAFVKTNKTYATEAFWSVNRAIESYLADWASMYTEACEATQVRGEQSAEVLDLRMSCLDGRLSGVKALGQIFVRADGDVVGNAVRAVGALPSLDRCGDVKLLRSMVQLPDDPRTRVQTEGLRRRLAEVRAARDAGRIKDAEADVAALVDDARPLDYPPVLAEAEALRGELETVAGDPKVAEATLQDAFWSAEAARDDLLKAEISAYLIEAVGYRQRRYDDAEKWIRQTQATLRRLGGQERLQAWVENNIAMLYHVQGRYDDALAAYRRSLAVGERALGPNDPDVARPLGNLAVALGDAKRPAEALEPNQRAIDIFRRAYGPGHPEVATHMSNRGALLNDLARWSDAREPLEAAMAIWRREYPADHPYVAETENEIGRSFVGEGRPKEAIAPLERALAIREKDAADPSPAAETRFLLARALWDAGGGVARERAIGLAGSAKGIYERDGSAGRDRAVEIDGWLAARRPAPAIGVARPRGGERRAPLAHHPRAAAPPPAR